jgi:hypothetical protein
MPLPLNYEQVISRQRHPHLRPGFVSSYKQR